jgi:peptidyl-prolyl cis-trans isomerase A (cyclophilin A)
MTDPPFASNRPSEDIHNVTRPLTIAARLLLVLLLLLPASLPAKPGGGRAFEKVRIETSEGTIVVRLDMRRAPITAANFLRYTQAGRFDNTSFYRAARNRKAPQFGLVQGGINRNARKAFNPIPHEPTSRTGLRHVDGTLSMARNAPGTAMGEFFFTLGPAHYLDGRPGSPGYAAFGRVLEGMPVLKKILAGATYPGGWSQATKGQSLIKPVRIIRVRRVG